jgi:outer membrane protein TolC
MSRLLACVLLAVLLPAVAAAQMPEAGAPAATVAPDRPLSLEEAIAFAMQKNFGLQIQAFAVGNAKENVIIQEATAFDPTLTAGVGRRVDQAAANLNFVDGQQTEGRRDDNTTGNVSVIDRIPQTNGTVRVTANLGRAATNNTTQRLNPAYSNSITAVINQPLLRDFGRDAARAALEQAQLNLNIANIGYKSAVMDVIANVENAYYALVTAREALHIRQLTLDASKRLFDETSARRSSGVATDLDVLSNEVQVANNQRALVQQEQNVRNAEERLLNLINVPTFDIRPGAVAFEPYQGGAPNFAQSYKLAREFYPDGLTTEQSIKQAELNLATARRNLKPDLDLQATLGYSARPTSESYFDTISNLPRDHGNNWSINLNYSLPWGQRADKARYNQAENNLRSQKVRLEQLEQQLIIGVRTAIRAVETNLVAVEIAAKATELASRQYDQQKARYDAGLSTARILQLSQDDLETARFNQLSAQLQLRQADSELRRLEGSSLQRFRVELPQ